MDKNELAAVIKKAVWENPHPVRSSEEFGGFIYDAVREYLGREETVERTAGAIVKQGDGCEWASMSDSAKDCERAIARAALTSIGGQNG